MWTTNGSYDNANDGDNCPGSGSIHLAVFGHYLNQCFPTGVGSYTFGYRFKGDGAGGAGGSQCDFSFYSDTNCNTYLGGGTDLILVTSNGTWVSGVQTQSAPTGTQAVYVHCATATGTGYYDQFYLRTTSGGF